MRLFILAALAAALAIPAPLQNRKASPQPTAANKELSPEELSKLLETRDKVFFLDVREPHEIAQQGSVKGYVNIPLGQLERRLNEIPKEKVIVTL